MRTSERILQLIGRLRGAHTDLGPVQLVESVDSLPFYIAWHELPPLALAAANVGAAAVPLPLTDQQSRIVYGLFLVNGPKADGTTANAKAVFLGDKSVAVSNGFYIGVGGNFNTSRVVDLADYFVVGLQAGDYVRIFACEPL